MSTTSELRVERVAIGELHEHPENPRTITAERLADLKKALDASPQMLEARPLIAQRDGTVIGGNMRLRAATELGWETIPVVYVELSDVEAREWALRDNAPYGEWDLPKLAEALQYLDQSGADLVLTGFPAGELDRVLDSLAPPNPDDDGGRLALAQATIGPPRHELELGARWRLGEQHTLICVPVYEGHPIWGPLLPDHDLFIPYPTPMLPLTERAADVRLLLVQPNVYLGGHLLDRYEDHFGEGSLHELHA